LHEDWQNGGFGLYIHWPFCSAKCPYCDFNSYVADNIDEARWVRAYVSEINRVGAETSGRILNSVFFGGGTPSLMSEGAVASILEAVRANWVLSNDVEISLEANPTSVEAARFVGYREAGINRVSLGLQALNDHDLKRLGRLHSASEGLNALEVARSVFERTSFDLIYSRQDQTFSDWKDELDVALTLAGSHLSMYQLTIEPNTAFGERYRLGRLGGLPSEDTEADMYFYTQDACRAVGLESYEVSNFAKIGSESRHNLIYWRYGDYLGIGPGAHGRVTLKGHKYATETFLAPGQWLEAVESNDCGESKRIKLGVEDQTVEFLLMGLRLSEGIQLNRFKDIQGFSLPTEATANLLDLGLISVDSHSLSLTPKGRPLINAILREVLSFI